MFSMLTLYYRPSCPFCRRVLAVTDRLSLSVELKDIADPEILAELESRGGTAQVPYLVDEAQGIEMYESDAIVSHLQSYYGKSIVSTRPRVHIADNVCIACEG
jgi:glutaredoxin 3